jgi:trehalose 6-phosphate synthase/phosphatase
MTSFNTLVSEKFNHATNRLALLDYDGTLVNYESLPDMAKPSKQVCDVITKLACKPCTRLIIISGRDFRDMDKLIGNLPVDLIAEHGAMIKENGKWEEMVMDKGEWKKIVLPVFRQIIIACPGSFLEEKKFTLAWHYRNAKTEAGYTCSRELIHLLEDMVHAYGLKILDGNRVVEVMSEKIGKGEAIRNIIEKGHYDCILSIGDDKTDEEMFEFLMPNAEAITIKVGNGTSYAKHRLPEVKNVLALLNHLLS